MKYIFHHLGLGDHIINNGLVHYYQKKFGEVMVFCKNQNLKNVKYMYRHNDKIHVICPGSGNDSDVHTYIRENRIINDTKYIGFIQLDGSSTTDTFDQQFYTKNGLDWSVRFEHFDFQRDQEKESHVYNELNPNNEDYIFIHGKIDLSKVRSDLKIIRNPEDYGIFDILKLIENSVECHLMESSIKCLVNSYKFDKPNFFYHQYVRGYSPFLNSKGLNEYKIIY